MYGPPAKTAPVESVSYNKSLGVRLNPALVARLAELHPARPVAPSMDASQATIDFLSGHSVRWGTPGTPLTNYAPRSVIFEGSATQTLSESDRLLIVGLVRYSRRKIVEDELVRRVMALPEIRVVLGTGYTLIVRPGADRGVASRDDPAFFASFVKTRRDDVTDAVACAYGQHDISVGAVWGDNQAPYAKMTLRVGTKEVVSEVPSSFMQKIGQWPRYYAFDTARILERLFPVLKK